MKKYLIFFILVTGCYSDIPDNLISEKKMESIIFDIMILNASSGYDLKIDNNLLSDELIFKKYDIDSYSFMKVSFITHEILKFILISTQMLKKGLPDL